MSPPSDTSTLSTPQRANATTHDASKIKSTPNSRGAAVISENIGVLGVQVPELRPWIQRDVAQAKQCKVDAMLRALLQRASSNPNTIQSDLLEKCLKEVLPVCNGQFSSKGISSLGIKTALEKYVNPGKENEFYGPFTKATNIALACLAEIKVAGMGNPVPAIDMICQQNDQPMYQTHQTETSMRKPDLVLLPLNSACAAFPVETDGQEGKQQGENQDNENDTAMDDDENDKKRKAHMDTNATGKPKNLAWKDILACLEFKRKTPGRTKGIKSPPSSYTATDYVPPKREYLPLEHLKAAVPEPDTSETPAPPQPSSGTAFQSSGLATAKAPLGGSGSKRKAADTLESGMKKPRLNSDQKDAKIDVTVQTGLYAAEMFASNLGVNYVLNIIVVGVFFVCRG
ncbi:hypothetical protein P692DRAFT_20874667 [Suillus brevipes Sb2]|nr:hypothetical protein P692DRAFT_20874667 [Suillus brevipes Sb2]